MARFDVYRNADGPGYLLDLQANILERLNTRIVVPLMSPADSPLPANRLNPTFSIEGREVIMVTQFMATVSVTELEEQVTSLRQYQDDIVDAVDFLMQGF